MPKTRQQICKGPCHPVTPRPTRSFAALFKALGDATRLEMIGLLAAAEGELCVCEIESHFELSQPTVSHHLRILRKAGLVRSERRGTWVYYRIDDGEMARVRSFYELVTASSAGAAAE